MKTEKQTASAEVVINDGLLRFGVKPVDSEEIKHHEVDVLLLKMTCEECELAHNLKSKDGEGGTKTVYATTKFLQDLAVRLQGLGIDGCSATVACQLWKQASQVIDSLKKNTNETPNSPSGSTSSPRAKGRKGR